MKKKIFIGLMIIAACFTLVGCKKEEKNQELDKIAKLFNKSESIKTYKEYGYKINATAKSDKIVITTKKDKNNTTLTFKFSENILSCEKITTEELIFAAILIDSVGQYQGYEDGELIDNLNAFPDKVENYTVENEGFELTEENDKSNIKIDITKKIPLIDLSNLYLKTSDFDTIKNIVEEKSAGNQTGKKSKLAYDLVVSDAENNIYIGEKDKLTDSAYKSILSALEVMYGSETANRFKSLYPSFKEEKTTIDEFTIDTNYKMENQDDSVFKDMQVVLVTIDNSKIKK